jgi:hypothetical protein
MAFIPMGSVALHAMTLLVFTVHIGAGALALASGVAAASARKGGRLHRGAGTVFFVSMLVMATFAAWLAVVRPGQIVNLFIAAFTVYLVSTAWMTVRRRERGVGVSQKIALFVALCLCAPFAILAFQLAAGLPPFFKSAVAFKGPVLIAIYGFTSVLAIAAVADAKVVIAGGISGAPRIARHLWRMCLGLTLATGSFFTNGVPRLLPGLYDVPLAMFLPQFLPLGLLIFWMIRVRFTDWFSREAVVRAAVAIDAQSSPISDVR